MKSANQSNIPLIDLVRYLKDLGWNQAEHPNEKIYLFQGPNNDNGIPLEIVIPRSDNFKDYNLRLNDTLKVLSIVEKKGIATLLNEIILMSHDFFNVRILDTGEYSNSIPLPYAADSISSLRDLFVYGACSEEKSLPYFERPLQIGINHANLCRFGHTFEGSFGLSINSPIINEYVQITMFEETNTLPFERRVMERIIRGLNLLNKSVDEDDADILVNNFDVGLNARMCESLLELSLSKSKRIGLSVIWSPKFEVSEDIKYISEWLLTDAYYEVLEYAAYELKKIEPYNETIVGHIVTLHSNKDPMSEEDFVRQATIKHEIDGRKVLVKLDLDKEGYTVAYNAHGKGLPIIVTGSLFRKGNTWRMIDVLHVSFFT